MESDLVQLWLRRDPIRWLAGVLAGLLAGATALLLAMWIANSQGYEMWFPIKLIATTLLGPQATQVGMDSKTILTGIALFETLTGILGLIFAHFTVTNLTRGLLAMGAVWGIFSWIFIWNLFLPSFRPIYAARIPAGPVLPICMMFGLSLASVKVFDSILRPNQE